MLTTVHEAPRGFVGHLWTWVQAIALVYLIGFAMVLLGAAIALPVRGAIEVLSWVAALTR
jgi:hypothetical protein